MGRASASSESSVLWRFINHDVLDPRRFVGLAPDDVEWRRCRFPLLAADAALDTLCRRARDPARELLL